MERDTQKFENYAQKEKCDCICIPSFLQKTNK